VLQCCRSRPCLLQHPHPAPLGVGCCGSAATLRWVMIRGAAVARPSSRALYAQAREADDADI
jgi:hypothetical protein